MSKPEFGEIEGVAFPFERGTWYPIRAFSDFEANVITPARKTNERLRRALEDNRGAWIKVRNEELWPMLHWARLLKMADAADFKLCSLGADADIEVQCGSDLRRIQVTTAGPPSASSPNWGESYRLLLKKLREGTTVHGTGPFKKEADGSISTRDLSPGDFRQALLTGLVQALRRKDHHRTPDCDLLVYAVDYSIVGDAEFERMARLALCEVPLIGFREVFVFDSAFIVERAGTTI